MGWPEVTVFHSSPSLRLVVDRTEGSVLRQNNDDLPPPTSRGVNRGDCGLFFHVVPTWGRTWIQSNDDPDLPLSLVVTWGDCGWTVLLTCRTKVNQDDRGRPSSYLRRRVVPHSPSPRKKVTTNRKQISSHPWRFYEGPGNGSLSGNSLEKYRHGQTPRPNFRRCRGHVLWVLLYSLGSSSGVTVRSPGLQDPSSRKKAKSFWRLRPHNIIRVLKINISWMLLT